MYIKVMPSPASRECEIYSGVSPLIYRSSGFPNPEVLSMAPTPTVGDSLIPVPRKMRISNLQQVDFGLRNPK